MTHNAHADSDAVSNFEVTSGGGTVVDGSLQVCPGTTVSLTCSHDSVDDVTRWVITPPLTTDCNTVITHIAMGDPELVCGPFAFSMVSLRSEPTRRSTLEIAVTESLNGAVVTCYAGASTSDPQAGNVTIQIIGEMPASSQHEP